MAEFRKIDESYWLCNEVNILLGMLKAETDRYFQLICSWFQFIQNSRRPLTFVGICIYLDYIDALCETLNRWFNWDEPQFQTECQRFLCNISVYQESVSKRRKWSNSTCKRPFSKVLTNVLKFYFPCSMMFVIIRIINAWYSSFISSYMQLFCSIPPHPRREMYLNRFSPQSVLQYVRVFVLNIVFRLTLSLKLEFQNKLA